jgi:hypothetical protein
MSHLTPEQQRRIIMTKIAQIRSTVIRAQDGTIMRPTHEFVMQCGRRLRTNPNLSVMSLLSSAITREPETGNRI